MKIIVRNRMFFVLDAHGNEKACADYISVVARIKGIMVLNTIEEV